MLSEADRQVAAEVIFDAHKDATACDPLSKIWPDMTLEDAYDIQARFVALKCAAGSIRKGYKVGVATPTAQKAAGVSEPTYGVIFADGIEGPGVRFAKGRFVAPKVECEVAFVLGQDLSGPCSIAYVIAATEAVVPSYEVVDFRTEAPRQTVDTVADNGAFGAIVMGTPVAPSAVDIPWIAATLAQNGAIEETGVAAGLNGDPTASVAWLAGKLADQGGLKAGDVVLTGAFVRPMAANSGDLFLADFNALGQIDVRFD